MSDRVIDQYLTHYAEIEAASVTTERQYTHAIVIPACREQAADVRAVWQNLPHPGDQQPLIIVVINSSEPEDHQARTLYQSLSAEYQTHNNPHGMTCLDGPGPDLLLVNRFSEGRTLDPRYAVGTARKIGSDMALALFQQGLVSSSWISTTDADVVLPADYLQQQPISGSDSSAMVFPFVHQATNEGLVLPVLLYETHMLYYAVNLKRAGSPYAFPTVGSTIRFSASHYARVRGFPRRATGEDFYLLNKLRKLGEVTAVHGHPIQIAGRPSDRVPVGTGRAITRMAASIDPISAQPFEDPRCFDDLRLFLNALNDMTNHPDPIASSAAEAIKDHPLLSGFAENTRLWERIKTKSQQSPQPAVMRKYLHDWFDGLRTRQLIHYLRDHGYGTVTVQSLCNGDITAYRDELSALIYQTDLS